MWLSERLVTAAHSDVAIPSVNIGVAPVKCRVAIAVSRLYVATVTGIGNGTLVVMDTMAGVRIIPHIVCRFVAWIQHFLVTLLIWVCIFGRPF